MIGEGVYFVAAASFTQSFCGSRLQFVCAMTAHGNGPVVDAVMMGGINPRVLRSLLFVSSALQREHAVFPSCFSFFSLCVASVCACDRLNSMRRDPLLFSEL